MGVHTKFRAFLKLRRDRAVVENRVHDWAYVKDAWRPIKSYRTVKRGRKKGQIEVELFEPLGRKRIIPEHYMRYKEVDYAEKSYAK